MKKRFKKNAKILDIVITAVGATLSVGIMLYGVAYFGLRETWLELVLNLFKRHSYRSSTRERYLFCFISR